MRLSHRAPRRVAIPAAPFANLALLLVTLVSIAAMFSVPRGVGLRFAPGPRSAPSGTEIAPTLIVAVGATGDVSIEGTPVAPDRLAAEVRERLGKAPEARVVLVVDPAAPYQAAIAAADPLLRAGVLDGRPLSIPSRRQAESLRANPDTAGRIP